MKRDNETQQVADECANFVSELQNFINHSIVGRQGTLEEKESHGNLHNTEFKTKEVLSE